MALASGTTVKVRVESYSSSDPTSPSDRFTATLLEPVKADGKNIPAGAIATGNVTGKGQVAVLKLDDLRYNGHIYALSQASSNPASEDNHQMTGVTTRGPRLQAVVPRYSTGVAVEFNDKVPMD